MSISSPIIQKMKSAFGITGRPHHILDNGVWIDTGCMEWSPLPSEAEIFAEISPDLKDALQRLSEFLSRETRNPSDTATAEFFSRESASIQTEFTEFNAKMQIVNSPNIKNLPLPDLSPEMQAASKRIYERLKGENFQKWKRFDSNRYSARILELFKEERHQIQTELAALKLQIRERDRQLQRVGQHKKHTLKQVRTLLLNEPVSVYRAGIELDDMPSSGYDTIIIAPTTDQFDILRYERTNGANRGLQTEDIIEKLKKLDETHGIDIVGAGIDGVEFVLKRVPKGKKALELGKWLLGICPDLYEAPSSFPKGKVTLWWD